MRRSIFLFLALAYSGFALAQNPGTFDRPIVVGITQADVVKSCDARRVVAVNMDDGSVCVCQSGSWVCATTGQLNLSGSGSAGQLTIWDASTVLGGDPKLTFNETAGTLETQNINLNKGAGTPFRYIEFPATNGSPGAPAAGGARLYFDLTGFYRRDATGGRLMLDTGNVSGHISVSPTGVVTINDDAISEPKLLIDNSGSTGQCLKKAAAPNTFTWATCGSGYTTLIDESTTLPQQTTVRFTGDGVSCVDNPGGARTDCTITGGPGGPTGPTNELRGDDSVSINADYDNDGTAMVSITGYTHSNGFKIVPFDIDGNGVADMEVYDATPRYGTGGTGKATTLRVTADGDCGTGNASCRPGFEFAAGPQSWSFQSAWHGAGSQFARYERANLDVNFDGTVDTQDFTLFTHNPIAQSSAGQSLVSWAFYNNTGLGSSLGMTARGDDAACKSYYPSDTMKWGSLNLNGTSVCWADVLSARRDGTSYSNMTYSGATTVSFANTGTYSANFSGSPVLMNTPLLLGWASSPSANIGRGSLSFDYWGDIDVDGSPDAFLSGLASNANETDYSASGGFIIGMYNASDPYDYAGGGVSTFVTKSRAVFDGWDDFDLDGTRDQNEVGKATLPGRLFLSNQGERGAIRWNADGVNGIGAFAKVIGTEVALVLDLDMSNSITSGDVCLIGTGIDQDCNGIVDPVAGSQYARALDPDLDGVNPMVTADTTNGVAGFDIDMNGAYEATIGPGYLAFDQGVRGRILWDKSNLAGAQTYKFCGTDITLMYDANNNGSYNAGDDYCWGVGGYDANCDCIPEAALAGSGAAGRVAFWTDVGTLSHDAGFEYDASSDTLKVGTIETTGASDGLRYMDLEDNSSTEPDPPSASPISSTRLFAMGGEFFKKDPGDTTNERLILNSGNLSGDVTASVAGVTTIQDNAVQESDLDITNAGSTNDCLKKSATSDKFDWGSCSTGGGYTTVQDEGTPLTQRTTLNFAGAGVSCADASSVTTCTISGGSGGNAFGKVSVSGQSDVDADSTSDQLTLVAGSNITLTTSAAGDSVTIAATGGSGDEVTVDGTAVTSPVNLTTGSNDVDFQLSGSNVTGVVVGLRTIPIAASSPSSGDVLKYNGSAWAPAVDSTGSASDPWAEVMRFEDFLSSGDVDVAGSATNCPLGGVSESGTGWNWGGAAIADHTNAGVYVVGGCALSGGTTNGGGLSFGYGAWNKDLDQASFAWTKMREFRTRFVTNGSGWTSVTGNQAIIVGSFGYTSISQNNVDWATLQRGTFFACAPFTDWDDDGTTNDTDNNWHLVISNDTDGTANFCTTDGTGGCTPDADNTIIDTGVVCMGSGRNDLTYEMRLSFNGGSLSAYLDDNNSPTTWTWSQTGIDTDLPTGGYVSTWGGAAINNGTGTVTAANTTFDWLYYKGTR